MQEKGEKMKKMVGEIPQPDEPLNIVRLRTKTSVESGLGESSYVTPKRVNKDKGKGYPGDGNTSSETRSASVPGSFLDSKL